MIFFYLNIRGAESILGLLGTAATTGLLYLAGWLRGWRRWWNERLWQGKQKYSEKSCPDATLSTTNPTCETRAAAVGNHRLTASAMARPANMLFRYFLKKACAQSCRGLPLGSIRITAAVALVDRDMLTRVWDEMDYRIDACRITKGGHWASVKYVKKKTWWDYLYFSVIKCGIRCVVYLLRIPT
jgi:hypothetical protein